MFSSDDIAEIPIPPGVGYPGERLWKYIRLSLKIPWLLVVAQTPDRTGRHLAKQSFFLTAPDILLELQETVGKSRIEEVAVILPGYMTGLDRWTMKPLAEIWRGREPEADQYAWVFVAAGSARYVLSLLDTPEQKLKGLELVFKIDTSWEH